MANIEDLTGRKFGKLTVIERGRNVYYGKEKQEFPAWVCECECGAVKLVPGHHLRSGRVKSCGKKGCKIGGPHEDLTGRKFGKLTVICRDEDVATNNGKLITWKVLCECGNVIRKVTSTYLLNRPDTVCTCSRKRNYINSETNVIDFPANLFNDCGIDANKQNVDLDSMLSVINQRWRCMLLRYYEGKMTLREIGELFEISEQRVHQIIQKAIKKIGTVYRKQYIEEKSLPGLDLQDTKRICNNIVASYLFTEDGIVLNKE